MKKNRLTGHAAAFFTIFVWGTTFISTKVLLQDFRPVEILVIRFVLGYLALLLAYPRLLRGTTRRQEGVMALAGLCGICLYYLLENIALTYTQASNVGVIISIAPFFTAILTQITSRSKQKLSVPFFIGFLLAMAGIVLISINGGRLRLNPVGDLLAAAAAVVWAVYAVLTKKISAYGQSTLLTTRRIFFYGLLFMVPASLLFGFRPDFASLAVPGNAANLLFLGIGASAMCFVTWNFAVKKLGAVKTSIYIYMVPVITVAASVIVLKERVTVLSGIGIVLTLAGLLLSQKQGGETE